MKKPIQPLGMAHQRARTYLDDAYISARYVQNLAAGNGLLYNIGEQPAEGLSNAL